MNRALPTLIVGLLLQCALLSPAVAAKPEPVPAPEYVREIKPLLKARCYSCHGALKQSAGLRLDTAEFARRGGRHGSVVAGSNSVLLARVTAPDEAERMPREGVALASNQVALLRSWIAAGAPGAPMELPEPDPRAHWSFQVPRRAQLPARSVPGWQENAIDRLHSARLRQQGLRPQGVAPRSIWLRRVYFDAIGLPPAADEIRAFEEDTSPDASRRVVDRLLARPEFGERWARHFMDIWRYSDWWGLDAQLRNSQKHLWHWRDWIVESLNVDKGYDRMILEMLAADELAPEDPDALRATGFLCRDYYLFNRTTWLDEVVEHTSRAFLGLTLQCAKCHDHKYDPLAQADYYRWRAVFEPYHVRLDAWPGEPDFEKNGLPRAFDLHLTRPTYVHRRGDEKQPETNHIILPGIPSVFGEIAPESMRLPRGAHAPGLRDYVLHDQLESAGQQLVRAEKARDEARRRLEELEHGPLAPVAGQRPAATNLLAEARAQLRVAEAEAEAAGLLPGALRAARRADEASMTGSPGSNAPNAAVREAAAADARRKAAVAAAEVAKAELELVRAGPAQKKEAEKKLHDLESAQRKAMDRTQSPGENYESIRGALKALEGPEDAFDRNPARYPEVSTGRRLALARWIASPTNPLTARVLVNHVWTRVFGDSFVPDVSDFGRRAPAPVHQAILDTLAVDFMERGWSIKHLLREMFTSRIYESSSSAAGADPGTLAADPDNKLWWRLPPKRLDAQALRDALLAVAGLLDPQRGGPPVPVETDEGSRRRALYFQQHGELEHRFLGMFDNASVFDCYRRRESITPQQALALANSRLTRECAEALERRLRRPAAAGDPASAAAARAFVREAFTVLLARRPKPAEEKMCLDTLRELRASPEAPAQAPPDEARARALLLQALMNHNDFVTLR